MSTSTSASTRLEVATGDSHYPIDIVRDAPGPTVVAALRGLRARRVLIVSDTNVADLHAAPLEAALADAGFGVATFVLPAGEQSKRLDVVAEVLDAAFEVKLARTDAFVAFGGGVVGDITGFAAAIFQRGVDVVQVPTSLLAQVDSSVGGKTGVNHAAGKNLIGAFWQPRAVVASQAVLATLPPREARCGLAEAVKHAFIADAALLERIRVHGAALARLEPEHTAWLVAACCRIKAAVVAEDPREDPVNGRRAVLNFGHTFGHAYEKLLGYGAWTHGEAVAVGMVLAARLSERLALAAPGLEALVRATLAELGLPHDPDAAGLPGLDALIAAAATDKKGDAASVRFVLLPRPGEAVVQRVAWSDVRRALTTPSSSGGA